jgi:hypothetical protein
MSDITMDSAHNAPLAPRQPKAPDACDLAERLARLNQLTRTDLRAEWRRLYRTDPPKKLSHDLLELALAWKLQEKVLGGLSASVKRQIADLAMTMETRSDLVKARTVSLKPGARLLRSWRGDTHEVVVVDDGFVWAGRTWRSLSAIAREMTGTRWSGPRFFGLIGAKVPMNADAAAGGAGA